MTRPDATELARLVRVGELAPLDPAHDVLAALSHDDGAAVTAVVAADDLRCDDPTGALAGVPILLKELGTHAAGLPNREGLRFPGGDPDPVPIDAAFVARLRAAGAVIVGSTATTEMGLTARLDGRPGTVPVHPRHPEHTPGGSSTGAAVAVASDLVPIAHGTDGGGSIRIPAAFCGLVGLKPSRGSVSFGPVIGDTLGSLAVNFGLTRSVRDAALLLDVVAGAEPGDPYGGPVPPASGYAAATAEPGRQLRIAVCLDVPDGALAVDPEVAECVQHVARTLVDLGHHVEERPGWLFGNRRTRDAMAVVWTAMAAEGARRALARDAQLGAGAAALAAEGERHSAGELAAALAQLSTVARRMERGALAGVDLVLSPVCPTPPPVVRAVGPTSADEILHETLDELLVFTYGANATGQPAISVPIGDLPSGLPAAAQLLGRWGSEAMLLSVAAALEAVAPIRG